MIHFTEEKTNEIKSALNAISDPAERRDLLLSTLMLDQFVEKRVRVGLGDLPINCEVYESNKKDPVIVFLPGIGTYAEMYCEFLYKLSQWGFNVVGVDIRGHGYSGGDRGEYTVNDVVDDLHDVVSFLTETYNDTIAFFGCSIGSPLAMACAENDDRIKSLLCHTLFLTEYPPDFMTFSGWNMLRYSRVFLPDFKIDFRSYIDVNTLINDSVFADFIDYDDLIVWEYSINTLSDIYSRKTSLLNEKKSFKAAIITGEKDEVIQPGYMKYITTRLEHPFEFIMMKGARHMLPFIHVKDTVIAARDWFKQNL